MRDARQLAARNRRSYGGAALQCRLRFGSLQSDERLWNWRPSDALPAYLFRLRGPVRRHPGCYG
jgi:hypothetical protein